MSVLALYEEQYVAELEASKDELVILLDQARNIVRMLEQENQRLRDSLYHIQLNCRVAANRIDDAIDIAAEELEGGK